MKKGKFNRDTRREKYEKWIKTNEDWYPYYEPYKYGNPLSCNAVHVTCTSELKNLDNWHVSVWGADDFGLEIWGIPRMEALHLYENITDFITIEKLRQFGLVTA